VEKIPEKKQENKQSPKKPEIEQKSPVKNISQKPNEIVKKENPSPNKETFQKETKTEQKSPSKNISQKPNETVKKESPSPKKIATQKKPQETSLIKFII